MGRAPRSAIGNIIYHVINRANGRATIFSKDDDYKVFDKILVEAKEKHPLRILCYCIMPNHWHLVLQPYNDNDLSFFMKWLTLTHTHRWNAHHHTVGYGHLYQGRFKSFPVQKDEYFIQLCKYVERNPLRAKLVKKAQDWKWSSLWIRERGTKKQKEILSPWPIRPAINYLKLLNSKDKNDELERIRESLIRGKPFGSSSWTGKMVEKLSLQMTLKPRGRPRKGT